MAFSHGKDTKVAFSGANFTRFLRDASNAMNLDMADTTAFGAEVKEYTPGLTDGSISFSGMYDGAAGAIDEAFEATLGVSGQHYYVLPAGDSGVGSIVWFGEAESSGYEITGSISDITAISMEVQADGPINRGVHLREEGSTSRLFEITSAPTDDLGASVNNAASSANGGYGQVQVVANDLDGNLTVKIQHSPDDATWADLITFAVVATDTTTSEQVAVTGTVDQYIRCEVDASASASGSAEVAVAFKRNA